MSEDISNKFMDFGALGYSRQKMKDVLCVDELEFSKLWVSQEKAYISGSAEFEFQIDRKLMELAINGDYKAIDKLAFRRGQ